MQGRGRGEDGIDKSYREPSFHDGARSDVVEDLIPARNDDERTFTPCSQRESGFGDDGVGIEAIGLGGAAAEPSRWGYSPQHSTNLGLEQHHDGDSRNGTDTRQDAGGEDEPEVVGDPRTGKQDCQPQRDLLGDGSTDEAIGSRGKQCQNRNVHHVLPSQAVEK